VEQVAQVAHVTQVEEQNRNLSRRLWHGAADASHAGVLRYAQHDNIKTGQGQQLTPEQEQQQQPHVC
jgi:hypothetical protein